MMYRPELAQETRSGTTATIAIAAAFMQCRMIRWAESAYRTPLALWDRQRVFGGHLSPTIRRAVHVSFSAASPRKPTGRRALAVSAAHGGASRHDAPYLFEEPAVLRSTARRENGGGLLQPASRIVKMAAGRKCLHLPQERDPVSRRAGPTRSQ